MKNDLVSLSSDVSLYRISEGVVSPLQILMPVNQDLSESSESCTMFWNSVFNVGQMRLNSTSETTDSLTVKKR